MSGTASAAAFERAHLAERARSRAVQAFWVGAISIVVYNLLLAANFLNSQIQTAAAWRVLAISQIVITLPCVAAAILCRRNRDPKRHDLLMLAAYGCVVLGSLYINACMTPEARVSDLLTQVMIPVAFNIAVPLSFRAALASSAAGIFMQASYCLAYANFSADDRSEIILVNTVSAGLALIANYRFERAERVHLQALLRENEKNQEIASANAALAKLSRTDYLTGVANRRAFDEGFAAAIADSARQGAPCSLLLIDIDHFKGFNDRFGHLEGDNCLASVARTLAGLVEGGNGFAGRYGGEEFAVVLGGAGIEAARGVAEHIRAAVQALAIPHPDSAGGVVTASLGVATLNPRFPETPAELIARADAALYRAKRKGRDCSEIDLRVVNG